MFLKKRNEIKQNHFQVETMATQLSNQRGSGHGHAIYAKRIKRDF